MLLYRNVRDAAIADVGRAIAMALGGALAFAPIEYVLTSWSYSGASSLPSKLRLAALTASLALWLWLLLVVALAVVMVGARLVRARIDPVAGLGRGWFDPSPMIDDIRPGVPRVWAGVLTGALIGLGVQRVGAWAIVNFKEPQLTAAAIAAVAVIGLAIASPLCRALALAARVGAIAVAPVFGAANPLGRWRAAGLALAVLVGVALALCWFLVPQSRSLLPIRLVISGIVIGLGMGLGVRYLGRRARHPRRGDALMLATASTLLITCTLTWWGADLETKYVAITASPALDKLIAVVRMANDLDRDGFGSLLGEADCAPFDRKVHPGALDKPDDHIDQNCDGHDFSMSAIVAPSGPTLPVPPQFKKDWNVLFLTIDTVRYDHTTFGGYADGPKKRDTTPRLAELVSRSTSFTFANAPSAGTMASIPAILTSKYFHSGIALDEKRPPGTPPGILPENVLLPEIMKRANYRTGVIGSHVWWNGWGLDQGVDDYDNTIAKTDDPFRVAADKVTDHALAWISRQQGKKWFLWAHYIDPHGRYVAHPDVVDYGATEPDLYDAELKWTDQQIGRLLDELVRLPSNANTIIVITSDHGDSMAEHNVPSGTHGTALYRELQHVPMIFYVPDNQPRQIKGAVTNLDIVPTIAELTGIDVRDLSFEGRSLVGSLFYGKEDRERIVFAETNAPGKQRAAISEAWKLIYYINNNVYELFDLKADPWEHTNLAPSNPPAMAVMKQALEVWMDRVLYARDPLFNQAFRQIGDVVSAEPPPVATTGQTLAGGSLEILGIGPAAGKPLVAGTKTDVHVYFRAKATTAINYKLQLVAWPATPGGPLTAPVPTTALRSALRATADGTFATDRWRAGDLVRERFVITVPADWHGDLLVGLVAQDQAGKAQATGAAPSNDPTIAILGLLPLGAQAGSSAPTSP